MFAHTVWLCFKSMLLSTFGNRFFHFEHNRDEVKSVCLFLQRIPSLKYKANFKSFYLFLVGKSDKPFGSKRFFMLQKCFQNTTLVVINHKKLQACHLAHFPVDFVFVSVVDPEAIAASKTTTISTRNELLS